MKQAGTVANFDNAASFNRVTAVFPFTVRGVSLLGVDSGYIGFPPRQRVWNRLAAVTRVIDFDAPRNGLQLAHEAGEAIGGRTAASFRCITAALDSYRSVS